jgi:hypothetical protein
MSDEPSDRLLAALSELKTVMSESTPDVAAGSWREDELQVFWREWPEVKSWADSLWARLNADLARPATPVTDPELDEVGGSG